MAGGAGRFFYRKQSVDTELAAFHRNLRIRELGEELNFLRLQLGDDDPEAFDEFIGNEERLFYSSGGSYGEYDRLRTCTELEVQKFMMLRTKETMLKDFYTLKARLSAKNKQSNTD